MGEGGGRNGHGRGRGGGERDSVDGQRMHVGDAPASPQAPAVAPLCPTDAAVDPDGRPQLIVYCGLPGSGKTTLARLQAQATGAARFCTDELMADLGLDLFDPLRGSVQARSDTVWRQLLADGRSVLLEDGSWTRHERDELRRFARSHGADTEIHVFDIPVDELWRRLEIRNNGRAHGTAEISRGLLDDCVSRFRQPDEAELALFDRRVMHR